MGRGMKAGKKPSMGGGGNMQKQLQQLQQMQRRMEQMQAELEEKEVETTAIGELVMRKLQQLDEVAYVRFASVYRQFTDVNTFIKEIEKLIGKQER